MKKTTNLEVLIRDMKKFTNELQTTDTIAGFVLSKVRVGKQGNLEVTLCAGGDVEVIKQIAYKILDECDRREKQCY